MKFTNESVHKIVKRIYGEKAEVLGVVGIFIPGKGWAPSLFDCKDGSLPIFLQMCYDMKWPKVQLKIRWEKHSFTYICADFSLSELAEE